MNIQVLNTDGQLRVVQNGRVRFYNLKTIKSVDSLCDTNNDFYIVINFIANDKENAIILYLKDITNQATWTNTSAGAEVAKGTISVWMQDATIVSGTVSLSSSTLTALENITVQNGPGAAAVNIQDGGNSITVDGLVDVDITHTDDSIQIYASDGANNVPVLVGTQTFADSLAVALCSEQAQIEVQAHLEVFTGTNGDLSAFGGTFLPSISFASIGTANALVRVDGVNVVSIPPGVTLNYDAGGVGNFYDPSLFTWDTSANPGASLIVTYNFY